MDMEYIPRHLLWPHGKRFLETTARKSGWAVPWLRERVHYYQPTATTLSERAAQSQHHWSRGHSSKIAGTDPAGAAQKPLSQTPQRPFEKRCHRPPRRRWITPPSKSLSQRAACHRPPRRRCSTPPCRCRFSPAPVKLAKTVDPHNGW